MGKKYTTSCFSYNPPKEYDGMRRIYDVMVPMRDGKKLCADIYLPDADGKYPALLACSLHNKDMQRPEYSEVIPPQPSWSAFWIGSIEAGDSGYLTSRGYVHVIANARNFGKSDSGTLDESYWDMYDLIEWIAEQEWSDENVGMIGISAFGEWQLTAASTQPPHLKAIYPYDPAWCYGGFRDLHPGGMLSTQFFLMDPLGVAHFIKAQPPMLPSVYEKLWDEAMQNPDYKMYGNIYNLLTQKGQSIPGLFYTLLDPYEGEDELDGAYKKIGSIKIPVHTGSGQYGIDYCIHWQGAQHWFKELGTVKKMTLRGPEHQERPFYSFHDEILQWYDYWLKGKDTGVLDTPPVRYWATGENRWHYADDWPVPGTKWTKYYLHSWERLRTEGFSEGSLDESCDEPDAFVQMTPVLTKEIQKLRYLSAPLPDNTLVAGPIALKIFASIDADDTNWIVELKDLGPDMSDRTARPGERDLPLLPEKSLTHGYLRASNYILDESRTEPYKPWHKLTRSANKKIVPGEIMEYDIEVMSVCHMFHRGHRICVEISCIDLPTGVSGASDVEYIPYHICQNKTVLHKIFRSGKYPSHVLIPVIPEESSNPVFEE